MNEREFWSNVDRNGPLVRAELGPCWVWKRASTDGYGRLKWKGRTRLAHQVAWELEHGSPPPAGAVIEHRCDNRACVRHLRLGTHATNAADRAAKGRGARQRRRRHSIRSLW